ncbi:MAG: CoA transferase [Candidatus Tectomicrobia bacterium]|nr:CoA transferase [Candidatus Tectomicrobia bacterium]
MLQTTMNDHALSGFRVLDLATPIGTYCPKLLADLGADVIKIEPPEGDPSRRIGPFKEDIPHHERSLYFLNFNTNKRGITLNLQTPDGKELFQSLVRKADIVVETFNPGYLRSLGLDYTHLSQINPKLILTSITPFGQTGPYKEYGEADIVGFAMGGLMSMSGEADGPPCTAPDNQAYMMTGVHAAAATLMALWGRELHGSGQQIDVSMFEVLAAISSGQLTRYTLEGEVSQRTGSHSDATPGDNYPCKDGHVRISIFTIRNWKNFVEWIGNPPELLDPKFDFPKMRQMNMEYIDRFVEEFTKTRTKAELYESGQKMQVPVTPVSTPEEFFSNSHTIAREFFVSAEHPEIGTFRLPGAPYKLSETPWRVYRPAPLLGEHNVEIYQGELELSLEDLVILKGNGVI